MYHEGPSKEANTSKSQLSLDEPYPLPPSHEVIDEAVPANWENRLTFAIEKLKERNRLCRSSKDQIRKTNDSIKKLREEYSKEKKHYSESVNGYAQQLHESIMRYEAARERKERFTERQRVLTAEYDTLCEKAQLIQKRELAAGQEKRTKADRRAQVCVGILEQLERARIAYLEQQRRHDKLFSALTQMIAESVYNPMEAYLTHIRSTRGDGDAFIQFCTQFLHTAQRVKEDLSLGDPQTTHIREMRDATMAFRTKLNASFLEMKFKSEQHAAEAKSLVCEIQSAESDAEDIQHRIVELASIFQRTD